MFKLLILDLDGTTVDSHGEALPSKRVAEAIKEAQKTIKVAIATGRPYKLALPVIEALDLSGLGVFNGGAEIIESSTGKILYRQPLTIEDMKELVKLGLPFGYKIYTEEDQYDLPLDSPDDIKKPDVKIFIEAVKTSDAISMLEELAAVETASAHPTTSWIKGDVVDIHITHINGTKRHGAERLLDILNIDKEHTIAVGDSHNDIPLLEAAGFKVAMGSAPDEVKAVADYVAPSVEDDGVADVIEKFILNQE